MTYRIWRIAEPYCYLLMSFVEGYIAQLAAILLLEDQSAHTSSPIETSRNGT